MRAEGHSWFSLRRGALALSGGVGLVLLAWTVAVYSVPLPAGMDIGTSPVVRDREGAPLHVFLSPDDKLRLPVDPARVDPDYLDALVALEDQRFWDHHGVDPTAIFRATLSNLRAGHVVSGASTITMQLARLLEPRPRTLTSKAIEAFRATQLEVRYSKHELLRAYLTRVPFGGNLEGIETAAHLWFGHGSDKLAPEEIALLLAVPQDPGDRRPSVENLEALKAARDDIITRLVRSGTTLGSGQDPETTLAAAVRQPVRPYLDPPSRRAPHAARWLLAQEEATTDVTSTLDAGVQQVLEAVAEEARVGLAHRGIHNGAFVVVDHTRSEVVGLLGNLDFFDAEHAGQMVAFDILRSPGSTLKPFIYAMAIDQGEALPEQLVPDVPVDYAGYEPKNYDGEFGGLVPLEDALSRSLNVPFVNLLAEVEVEHFIGALEQLGAKQLVREPGYYGLSAAIGGLEVTPLELAGFYAALAEGGVARRLVWRVGEDPGEATRVLSSASTWLTRRALKRRDRPDFPGRRLVNGDEATFHWKTGTSYGHRDAWAVGSGSRYTALVWLGNLDRSPSTELVGAKAAGPLLFDLLETLEPGASKGDPQPHELKAVEVCAFSGHLPSVDCPHTRPALARVDQVPTEPCPYHVTLEVDRRTGMAVGPGCRSGPTDSRTFVTWPAELERWLTGHHRWLPRPPARAPECIPAASPAPPRIISPQSGRVAILLPGVDPKDQELPLEADAPGTTELAWFVNGRFIGRARAAERLWWTPVPGEHEVLVMDGSGRSASATLVVR